MDKRWKKVGLILGSIATPGIIAVTAIACATPMPKPIVPLQENIKYLAFGDSVTAGYNAELGFDAPGKMENGMIEGLSYPAFIAKYIQEMGENKLSSFDNYGLSGSTVEDWLYILGDQSFKEQAEKNLARFLAQDTTEVNPTNIYAGRIAKQFGAMGQNFEDFTGIKSKIKEADLITITLGANDFLKVLYAADLGEILNATTPATKISAIAKFSEVLETAGKTIVGNIIKLNNLMRRINPNAKVAYAGYAMPLLRVVPILDQFLGEVEGQKVSSMLLGALNKIVKNGAKLSGHNYVATFDESVWNERPELLSKIFYDIHPTGKGYKKMAQEIFLKLALEGSSNNPNYNHYFDRTFEDFQLYNKTWTYNYWQDDQFGFNRLLNLGSNDALVTTALGSPKNEKLWETSNLEATQAFVDAINKHKINVGVGLRDFLLGNSGIAKVLVNVVIGLVISYDTDGSLQTMLLEVETGNDKSRMTKLLEALINGEFFLKAMAGLQEQIDNEDLDQNGIKGVQRLSQDILFSALVRQLLIKTNIRTLVNDLLTLKITGTNQSILQYATPILGKMLASIGADPSGSVTAFFEQKDITGTNNLEKLVKTFTDLPAFEIAITRMEQSAAVLPANQILGFGDLFGTLFGELRKDFGLMHQLLVEFITSNFVQNNNEVVKKELSGLLKGLLGSMLETMMGGVAAAPTLEEVALAAAQIPKYDPELPYAPSPFDNFGKIAQLMVRPQATQVFLGQLVEALLENKDQVYSKTTTIGTLLKTLLENNQKNLYTWVNDLVVSLTKDNDFREYFFYTATREVLGYLKEQTSVMKEEYDALKISDPETYNDKGYENFTLTNRATIIEIRRFLGFTIDYMLENSRQMNRNSRTYPGLQQRVYATLVNNVVEFMDGEMTGAELTEKLKTTITPIFKGSLIFVPEQMERLKKMLPAGQYQALYRLYKEIEPIMRRFLRGVGF